MKTMLVGYDLTEGEDYDKLWAKLKSYYNWWHHLDSTWVVRVELTAKEVREELRPFISSKDELLVIDVTGDSAAWLGFSDRGSKWLKDNL